MFKRLLVFLFSLSMVGAISAQDPTPPSDLEGAALRNWLRQNWYQPWHEDLGYSGARVEMFGYVDNVGGNISCVYTGFTQQSEFTSFPDPINTEHTVPQSFFNSQLPMRSDLHHLFPTHGDANSRRGSLSFDEVIDNNADEWLITNGSNDIIQQSNVPSSNIDAYSEVQFNVDFEPREEQKGNTARAVLYFYTMYPSYLTSGGDLPFEIGELDQMYAWHVMDPPDAQEIERNERIQEVQGNYNPYISNPSLVAPAWGFVSSIEENELTFSISPNPTTDRLLISQLVGSATQTVEVIDLLGNVSAVSVEQDGIVDVAALRAGVYLLRVRTESGVGVRRFVKI